MVNIYIAQNLAEVHTNSDQHFAISQRKMHFDVAYMAERALTAHAGRACS